MPDAPIGTEMSRDLRSFADTMRQTVADAWSAWENRYRADHGRPPSTEEVEVWGEQALVSSLEAGIRRRLSTGQRPLTEAEEDLAIEVVRQKVFGFGVLDTLTRDPDVENILANGHRITWLLKTGGRMERGPALADSEAELEDIIRRLAATAGRTERRFDDAQPYLDLRLPDGSRLHAIKSVSSRLSVSIRVHRHKTITMHDLVRLGTHDPALAHALACAVSAPMPCSIMVAGGTDTGKTTYLRGLISEIDPEERLVVIEDNAELQLEKDPARSDHVVEMEARQPNIEGVGGIGMDVLVKQSLRMRPDRVIVGECRSGNETVAMLDAMNTGLDGSLTTIHADSSLSALTKLQTYALRADHPLSMEASGHLIALVVHLVVHLRKAPDGRRVVSSVREVIGVKDGHLVTNEVYAPGPDGAAVPTGVPFTERMLERMRAAGYDHRTALIGVPS